MKNSIPYISYRTLVSFFGYDFAQWIVENIRDDEDSFKEVEGRTKYNAQYLFDAYVTRYAGEKHSVYTLVYLGTVDAPVRPANIECMPALVACDVAGVEHFYGVAFREKNTPFNHANAKFLLRWMLVHDLVQSSQAMELEIDKDQFDKAVSDFITSSLWIGLWIELGITTSRLAVKFPNGVRIQRYKETQLELANKRPEDVLAGLVRIGNVQSPILITHQNPVIDKYLKHFLPAALAMKTSLEETLRPELAVYGIDLFDVKFNEDYVLTDGFNPIRRLDKRW